MGKAFWIEVAGAVVLVAAMGVGFFFDPLIGVGIVLLGSAVAGWLAGRRGNGRGLGGGLLALLALVLIFSVCVFGDARALSNAMKCDGNGMALLGTIPVSFTALTIGAVAVCSLLTFFCFFNPAILFKRWYAVLGAALVLLAELSYLSTWLYAALGAIPAAVMEPFYLTALLILAVLLLAFLAAWAVCNTRFAKRRNWRNFAWCAGGFAVGSFLVWGISALSLYICTGALIDRTANAADPRRPVPPELLTRELELRSAADPAALRKRGIELPLAGRGRWIGAKGKTVSAEAKQRTQEFAASADGKAFFTGNRELIDLYCRIAAEGEFVPGSSPYLKGYRDAVNRCAAQAALAHNRKDTAAILPALEPAEKLEQALYDHEATMIEGLVRIALTSIRMNMIIGCGPTAPEYAAQYREILKRFLAREAKVSFDVGWIRGRMQRARHFERLSYPEDNGVYDRIVYYPLTCASLVYELRQAETEAKLASEWRKSGKVKLVKGNGARNAMRRALECRALYATALALKIYRCEKGEYPQDLAALVPGYLDKLPCDPVTGKALRYKKFPKGGFMLSAPSGRFARTGSAPRY